MYISSGVVRYKHRQRRCMPYQYLRLCIGSKRLSHFTVYFIYGQWSKRSVGTSKADSLDCLQESGLKIIRYSVTYLYLANRINNRFISMGCCYSLCKEDGGPQGGEVNERTHLLVDPVSNNTNIPRVHSDDYVNQYASSAPKKTDEQSALNRILHETAANVIDVGALDSHNLEQHEYMDRSRAYSKRIEGGGIKVPDSTCCLLKDIPAPEKILAADPLAAGDHGLITEMLNKAVAALEDVKVEHKEDLVVPFLS